jgi:predicted nucleic acid-binding protein
MRRFPRERVLVDTGPLVAILSREDAHHQACVAALREMPAPLFSCWPVITEAAWLLRSSPRAIQQLLGSIDAGFLELLPLAGLEAQAIGAVMKKYGSIRPQLADAALVYLAGRERIETVFTLDRRDFSIYRTGRRRAFRILPQVD